jgi:hypothetical protein
MSMSIALAISERKKAIVTTRNRRGDGPSVGDVGLVIEQYVARAK